MFAGVVDDPEPPPAPELEPDPPPIAEPNVSRGNSIETVTFGELLATSPDPPPMLAVGIPEVGVTVQAGPPKTGKSALAMQLALTIGARRPDDSQPDYLGAPPRKRGSVLYIAEEGSRAGIAWRARTQAAALELAGADVEFVLRQRIRLDDPGSVQLLGELVAARSPVLIVVDPLNRVHGRNEDRATEMTPVMDVLSAIAYQHACAVVLIHHVNKPAEGRNGQDRQRGSTAIRSGSDANLLLEPANGVLRLTGEYRDHEPLSLHLELDPLTMLMQRADPAGDLPGGVPPADLRAFVEERGQVTAREVMARFGIKSKNTARDALEALPGLDRYDGLRGVWTYTFATVQEHE